MDDRSLWNALIHGNETSFQEIYSTYYQNLYSYGMRKINQPDLVRDCIQDLFIMLWTRHSSLGPTDNIKYYLLASLRNLLIKVSLADGKWQKVELSSAESFQMTFDPESELIKRENISQKAKLLIAALDQLTPRQKEVLYLRFFEELSYEQIAELLNLSVKGVYKLNYRALDALKLLLNLQKSELFILLLAVRVEIFRW